MPAKTLGQGAIYEQAAQFAAALETSQVAAADQMLAAWTDSYWGVRKDLDAFLAKVEAAKAAGTPPSPAWAFQQQRLKNVLDTTKTQIARYAADSAMVTTKAQQAAISAALKHADKLAASAVAQSLPGFTASLASVNPKALESMAGFLADGTVLRNHLALTLPGQAAEAVQKALIHGLATGKSQAWMLRAATEALGISHTRATTILRTESLRAYRHATRATYLANQDVLGTWVWNAHLDSRTCVACALMDGTEHPLDATLDGHPRCRCAMVPRTKTWEELGAGPLPDTRPPVRSGKEWLESQAPHVQRAMMGNAKFNAWVDGTITLDDMVARTFSPQWGTMRTERSLKAILEDRNANWQDVSSLPPVQVIKPPPVADPKAAQTLADRHDLDYLQEWLGTPGNSPNVVANVQAAIHLKVLRLGRQGPTLPRPDAGVVTKAVEKLKAAVLTKGYPSKGYSQTQAIYKAQAHGAVGSKVGVVKSLTWQQKVNAQAILRQHNEELPDLVRQADKKAAIEKAHGDALVIHAQKKADEAAQEMKKALEKIDANAVDHQQWTLQMDLLDLDLEDALKVAANNPDDLVMHAQVQARLKALLVHKNAYQDAQDAIKTNGWAKSTWTPNKGAPGTTMEVDADGWAKVGNDTLTLDLPPHHVVKMLDGTNADKGMASWTQVLTPDPAGVKDLTDSLLTDLDGYVSAQAVGHWTKQLDDGALDGLMAPQVQANLKEALAQAEALGKWKPDPAEVLTYKNLLDDGTLTVEDLTDEMAQAHTSAKDKANLTAAIQAHQAEQIAKAAIPVPKPVIDPAKVKWEKVSDAQVTKLVAKVQSGEQSLDDLYAAYQKSKNAGPKANYAKAILTLEGKDVGNLPTPKAPTVPTSQGPLWPTKPPWDPGDLKDTGKVLGTHGARVYEAPDGGRWLFKPPKDPGDGFLTTLDEAASRFQAMVGLKAPDTYVVTLGGRRGSIQRMFDSKEGFPNGFNPKALTGPDLAAVQREHVLDWMLANHDGHRDQFLRLPDGNMVGIDKGQAFRWFGQDSLDWDFHPNQAYGAPPPVYNALWRSFADGTGPDLDPPGTGPVWDQIKAIQAIPEKDLKDLFRPYAEQAAARGLLAKRQSFPGLKSSGALENDVEAFLDALVKRQRGLDDDFRALYDRAAKARAKAIPGWKPKAAVTKAGGAKAKWVGKEKPDAPTPPIEPKAQAAQVFDSWLDAAKARYSQFAGPGKTLEASNNWARFRRVVDDLDETAAKELLDRQYLRPEDYQEALDLIAKAKAQKAALEADYKRALAAHAKAMKAYQKDLGDWKDANGIKDLTAGMDGALRHKTDQAGLKWAEGKWDGTKYKGSQRTWLRDYTGSLYDSLNDHLRKTKGKPTDHLDAVKNIDNAMGHIPIPEDVILHRGVGAARYGQHQFTLDGVGYTEADDLAKLIGSVQVDHGFISTSVGNSAAFSSHPIQLKIRAPKGTPASLVTSFSNYGTAERELILGRGQRMFVHNAYKKNGKWFLEVEIVPEDFDAANGTASASATPWDH